MSLLFRTAPARRAAILFASGLVCAVVPSIASASAVNLGTASPFVVLGASTVTNTGPSVLGGDLGVAPGTSLTGFGSPAVVNGATHDDDAVAVQAEDDLTTAYNTAAGQAVPAGNVLTGQDLGGMTLTPGAYSFASSAQLTGTLTLDAEGNPDAQFVFEVGSTLTTASASSVVLINGASPCDVYWQIGSSATLGSATAFAGNLMAHASITLNSTSSNEGRLLAQTGAVTLDDNNVDNSMCTTSTTSASGTGTSTPPTSTTTPTSTSPTTSTTPTTPTTPTTSPPSSTAPTTPNGSGTQAGHPTASTRLGTATLKFSPSPRNDHGFTVTVSGRKIKRVVFTVNGKRITTRIVGSTFRADLQPDFAGSRLLKAHVTFKDATPPRTLTHRFGASVVAVVHPRPGASTFTG